jgi:hypothetical protein
MSRFTLARTVAAALVLATPLAAAHATFESPAAKAAAADAAEAARADMRATFGKRDLANGAHVWKKRDGGAEVTRVVIDLSGQLAFAYAGDELVGVSTISSGTDDRPTPTGIFPILEKKRMHRSIKYDNAPMPYMQRLDDFGIAMHGGNLPGYRASHGCVRLPVAFAAKLFAATEVGAEVMIGAPGEQLAASGERSRRDRW